MNHVASAGNACHVCLQVPKRWSIHNVLRTTADSASDRVPGPNGLDSSNFLARMFLNPLLKKLVANAAYRRKRPIPLGERAQFFADCFRSVVTTKNRLSEPPVLAHAAAACRVLKGFALPLSAGLFHRTYPRGPATGH